MADLSTFVVVKASGETAPFDLAKFRRSLENSGAGPEIIDEVTRQIMEQIRDGITTRQLYKSAYTLLKKLSTSTASKYSLKRAIFDLGPSGYPFEKFVAELLKYQGYSTKVGQMVNGHCVQHEIDVVAIKADRKVMVECKFHSDQTRKTDVKVPLYIHSRFLDVQKRWRKLKESETKFYQCWVVTNTRFSDDASTYGNCVGLKLISWDYPKKGSLKQRISLAGLHPVTCLSTLTKEEKEGLLGEGVVLCKHLCTNPGVLEKLQITTKRQKRIVKEASEVCKI